MEPLLIGFGVIAGLFIVLILVLVIGKKHRKQAKNEEPQKAEVQQAEPEAVEEEAEEEAEDDGAEELVPEQEEAPAEEKKPAKRTAKKAEKKQPEKAAEEKKSAKAKKEEAPKEKKGEKNMDDNQTYRIVYDKEQKNWIVKIDGGQKASRRCKTKAEALEVAKNLAKKKDADLSVHKKNGKFQKQK